MSIDYQLRSAESSLGIALVSLWVILWRAGKDTFLWPLRLARYLYRRAVEPPSPPLQGWGFLDSLFLSALTLFVFIFSLGVFELMFGNAKLLVSLFLICFSMGMLCGIPVNYSKIYHPYVADDEENTLEW
tara:strand:+ start:393800 stop:394189 length:390 start_codon:yes stop_codon:yes gene_type:complete